MPLREPEARTSEYKGRCRVGRAMIRGNGEAGQRHSIFFQYLGKTITPGKYYQVYTYIAYTHWYLWNMCGGKH